jgi:hypothetical protein
MRQNFPSTGEAPAFEIYNIDADLVCPRIAIARKVMRSDANRDSKPAVHSIGIFQGEEWQSRLFL